MSAGVGGYWIKCENKRRGSWGTRKPTELWVCAPEGPPHPHPNPSPGPCPRPPPNSLRDALCARLACGSAGPRCSGLALSLSAPRQVLSPLCPHSSLRGPQRKKAERASRLGGAMGTTTRSVPRPDRRPSGCFFRQHQGLGAPQQSGQKSPPHFPSLYWSARCKLSKETAPRFSLPYPWHLSDVPQLPDLLFTLPGTL